MNAHPKGNYNILNSELSGGFLKVFIYVSKVNTMTYCKMRRASCRVLGTYPSPSMFVCIFGLPGEWSQLLVVGRADWG